jgi:RHS repeat-associated protein
MCGCHQLLTVRGDHARDELLGWREVEVHGGTVGCEQGLQYNNARYYDPATGQWISQDPVGSGSNWYEYVGNDPTNANDPSGLIPYPDPKPVEAFPPTGDQHPEQMARQQLQHGLIADTSKVLVDLLKNAQETVLINVNFLAGSNGQQVFEQQLAYAN